MKRHYRWPPRRVWMLAVVTVTLLAINSWHRNYFTSLFGGAGLLVLCSWGGIWFADPYHKERE